MFNDNMKMVIGKDSPDIILSEKDVLDLCTEALFRPDLDGKKILVIIPDHSRTAPIDMMFRTVYKLLANRVALLDFMVALGTHPPMNDEAINKRVGITKEERNTKYSKARFFNHHWKDPDQLCIVGVIQEDEVFAISKGLMRQKVKVTVNKMVYDYDIFLMIIGPTFPHEVVGFSGGNKYLFPEIAGQEIIDMFHWLGALITNVSIIGGKYTPTREIIDKAAAFLPMERLCMNLVVKGNDLAGRYIGSPEKAWSAAADLFDKIHIIYKDRPYHSVLSRAPGMYDDLWTGGKCMYKLEPVVADGGELIIYAPHIKEVSVTHGAIIQQIGYHVRDYYLKQWEKFKDFPGGILVHSTHVKGAGEFVNGVEKPRITVTLATGIPEKICRKINLGYLNPDSVNIDDWKDRKDEGYLYITKAGEMLYKLRK